MRSALARPPSICLAMLYSAAMLLAGCQSAGERTMTRAQRKDSCGAKPLRSFVGRKADQATREAIKQRVPVPRQIRWIVLGDDILADLQTGRVNIVLDRSGMIKGVGCY
jgi:hypothetical protein